MTAIRNITNEMIKMTTYFSENKFETAVTNYIHQRIIKYSETDTEKTKKGEQKALPQNE